MVVWKQQGKRKRKRRKNRVTGGGKLNKAVASVVVFNAWGFSLNWLFTLIAFDRKRNAVTMQTGVKHLGPWPVGEKKLHRTYACIRDELLYRFVSSSFDSGPCVACSVRIRDVLLLHNWGKNYLFCSHCRDNIV